MKSTRLLLALALPLVLALVGGGCGKKDGTEAAQAGSLEESAVFLEKAFANATPEVKTVVQRTCDALRKSEFEEAVLGVQALKGVENSNIDQGMALHGAIANLQAGIGVAMASGDPKAKRAYELLKNLRPR